MAMDKLVKKVLVVEDESYIVERIREILKKFENVNFYFVDSAKLAREKLETGEWDIVITDVFIYGITSLEVNKLAHGKNSDECVIVLTSTSSLDIAQKTVKEGAFDYVLKPEDIERIESLLKIYLLIK
jgi:DNA-binding NtrC family response regulator